MQIASFPRLRSKQDGLRSTLERHGLLVGLAVVLWLVAVGRFAAYGFTWHTFILWFAALLGVAQLARLADGNTRTKAADLTQELIPLAGLFAIFAPLYLLFPYYLPQQVNTDEISLMIFERLNLTRPINLLGVSSYFSFPSLPFILFSRLGLLLGGINLTNMRLVHAGFGLLIIFLGYALFRLQMPRGQALGGAVLLGSNHALLGISRLAQWDNLSLLTELAALIVLVAALRRGSLFIAVLGGFLAGLSFYVYLPGRITIVIWLLYMGVCWLLRRDPHGRRLIVRVGVASTVSFLMVAAPITVGQLLDTRPGSDYYKKQLLIFPEGRAQQQEWFRASSIAEGIWINVTHGLTAFNNQEYDRGFIYENRGHGFLDPLTGVLLWAGVFYALRELRRKDQAQDGVALALTGFGTLWLTYTFITIETPNYTRMLVVLPFVAYLATEGLKRVAAIPLWPKLTLPDSLGWLRGHEWFAIGVFVVGAWNALIYSDYLEFGFKQGNLVGATARLVARRSVDTDHTFYLFADEAFPYYSWGIPDQWKDWIDTFALKRQVPLIQPAEECRYTEFEAPFTAFMNSQVWELCRPYLLTEFPTLQVESMRPDGTRLAVEVP